MDADQRAARADAYESVRGRDRRPRPGRARGGCSTSAARPAGWPRALKERGPVEVVGIEREPAYAAIARERCDRVVVGRRRGRSRERPRPLRLPRRRRRARAPRRPLERARAPTSRCSSPAAARSISLPNAAHWTTYAALARGSWPRRPEGIHDATHLRWFTLRDAVELCEGAGLRVEHVERRPWAAVARHPARPPRRARSRGCRRSPSSTCSPRDGRRMARP